MLATLSASVRQLEHERDKLLEQLNQNNKKEKKNSPGMSLSVQRYKKSKAAIEGLASKQSYATIYSIEDTFKYLFQKIP